MIKTMENKIKILKAISDQNRIRILKMLQNKVMCVCEITQVLKLATSTVSNHLSILKEAGLLIEKKEGKWINYSINNNSKDSFINSIIAMLNLWFEDEKIIEEDRIKSNNCNRDKICKLEVSRRKINSKNIEMKV